MTIVTNDRRRDYTGNGVTTVFAGPKIFATSHLQVYLVTIATQVAVLQTTGFTVTGVGLIASTVTFSTAPTALQAVLLLRTVPVTQTVNLRNQGAFLPEVIEDGLDLQAMSIQQISADVTRAIKLPITSAADGTMTVITPLAPLVGNAGGTALEFGSTLGTGDMLLRTNLADSVTSGYGGALVAFKQTGTGAIARDVQSKQRERLSLLDFIPTSLHAGIADRTNVTALQTYVVSAMVKASAAGKDVELPDGVLYCSAGFTVDESADTDDYSPRAALMGQGASNTVFDFGPGNYTGINILGGTSGAGTSMNVRSGGFGVRKSDRLGIGVAIDNVAFFALRDIQITGWLYGFRGTDVLSGVFDRVTLYNNDYGANLYYVDGSSPNALSFHGCNIRLNKFQGLRLVGAGSVSLYNGAIEGNGWGGTGIGCGIYMEDAASESSVGLAIHGTYFEANEGVADVWIKNTNGIVRHCAHDLSGASFNRISSTAFTTNNIRIENLSTSYVSVRIGGCGFKRFGTYAVDAGRPYINKINTGGGTVRVNTAGANFFMDVTEHPELTGIADTDSSFPIANGRFSVTGGGPVNLVSTKNVASATYTATGDYVVTLTEGITGGAAGYNCQVTPANAAFCSMNAYGATDTTITIKAFDAAGVAMNPTGFSLEVTGLRL